MDKIPKLFVCLRFFSRLPLPVLPGEADPLDAAAFVSALRLAPFAGALLGLGEGLALLLALWAGAPPPVAALLALAAMILASGAMHEDGFADVADGFGGGATLERKLEIMRDSRLGTYGATALILSIALRAAALTALAATPLQAVAILVAAGAVSRAACLAPVALLPAARSDGAGKSAGAMSREEARPVALAALAFAALPGLVGFSFSACFSALALASLGVWGLCQLARQQIGGQTGDVAGAAQQIAEILFLCSFAAAH